MAVNQFSFDFEESAPKKAQEKNLISATGEKKAVAPAKKRGRKSLTKDLTDSDLLAIPEDAILFQKQYYAIGEVAEMFKENISLIRFWANEFSILKPKTNKKGDRFFRPEDVKNLKMIYHLLRERKYTIEGAKEFLKNNKGAGEKYEMIESLEKIKSFLLELKNNL